MSNMSDPSILSASSEAFPTPVQVDIRAARSNTNVWLTEADSVADPTLVGEFIYIAVALPLIRVSKTVLGEQDGLQSRAAGQHDTVVPTSLWISWTDCVISGFRKLSRSFAPRAHNRRALANLDLIYGPPGSVRVTSKFPQTNFTQTIIDTAHSCNSVDCAITL